MIHDPELVEYSLGEHEYDGVRSFGEQAVRVSENAQAVIEALQDSVQDDGQLGDELLGCGDVVTGFWAVSSGQCI
jgi:hypothetical protein